MMSGILQHLEESRTAMFSGVLHFGPIHLDDDEQSEILGNIVAVRAVAVEDQALAAHMLEVFRKLAGLTWVERCLGAVTGDEVQDAIDVVLGLSESGVVLLCIKVDLESNRGPVSLRCRRG
jgi:hypothetical protein